MAKRAKSKGEQQLDRLSKMLRSSDLTPYQKNVAKKYGEKLIARRSARVPLVPAHEPERAKCGTCYVAHLPSDHASHGEGSYERTHSAKTIKKAKKTAKVRGKMRRAGINPRTGEIE